MKSSFKNAVDKYLKTINNTDWIHEEAYKFEFANFINQKVNWQSQSDSEILEILKQSQKIRYTGNVTGIQFILRSAREKMSNYIGITDIGNFRQIHEGASINEVKWEDRNTSYPGISAWLGSLFPHRFYPIPVTDYRDSILYLFDKGSKKFPKRGLGYITESQPYFEETEKELRKYPIEDLMLLEHNKFYRENSDLDIPTKTQLDKLDWVWVSQDFHLFVFREILGLYDNRVTADDLQEEPMEDAVEGKSIIATHRRYERNSSLVRKVKQQRLEDDPLLQCDVCGFSFIETYGDVGKGFIEAHHTNPLSEREGARVTKADDLALLCSNCHRMAHKGDPIYDIDELKEIVNNS